MWGWRIYEPAIRALTSPICAQGATGDNPRILTFANPELNQSKVTFIAIVFTKPERTSR